MKKYITSVLHYFIEYPKYKNISDFKKNCVEPYCKDLEQHFKKHLCSSYASDVVNQLMNCLSTCVLRIHVNGPDPEVFSNWCNEEVPESEARKEITENVFDSTGCKRHDPKSHRIFTYYLEDPQEDDQIECQDVTIFGRQDKSIFERIKDVVLGNQEALYMDWCYSAAQSIVNAIWQPSITEFISKKEVCLLNEALLPKLRNLEVLNICHTWYPLPAALLFRCFKYAHKLEDISYPMCSDELVGVISKSCPELKTLNISGSEEVTNKSVKLIVSLRNLQVLDVSNTWINDRGLDKFCSKLGEQKESGQRFSKFSLSLLETPSDLEAFVQTVPNLTSLSLCLNEEYFNLSPLRYLKCLTDLSIRGQIYLDKQLFESVGSQITNLSLLDFVEVDLNFISEYFPNLQTLVLCQDRVHKLRSPLASDFSEENPAPYFRTVENLCLIIDDLDTMCLIISKCENAVFFKLEDKIGPHHILKLTLRLLQQMKGCGLQEINIADKIKILRRGEGAVVVKHDDSWDENFSKEVDLEIYSTLLTERLDEPLEVLVGSPWWWTAYHDICNENYVIKVLW